MKYQSVKCPLGAGALGGGVFGKRKLKKGVELYAFAAEPGVFQKETAAADIAGPDQWRRGEAPPASGLEYPALLDRLIALALERHAEKQQLRTSI